MTAVPTADEPEAPKEYFDVKVEILVTRSVTVRLRSLDKHATTVADMEKQALETLRTSKRLELKEHNTTNKDITTGYMQMKPTGIEFAERD